MRAGLAPCYIGDVLRERRWRAFQELKPSLHETGLAQGRDIGCPVGIDGDNVGQHATFVPNFIPPKRDPKVALVALFRTLRAANMARLGLRYQ